MMLKNAFFFGLMLAAINAMGQDTVQRTRMLKFKNFFDDDRTTINVHDSKVDAIKTISTDTTAKKKRGIIVTMEFFDSVVDPSREGILPPPRAKQIPKVLQQDPSENAPLGKRLFNGPSQFDSRVEPLELNPKIKWQAAMLTNCRSVAIVVPRSVLHKISDSIYQISILGTLGDKYQLCSGEAFVSQPIAGVGTAFMTGTNTMMTASHVISGPINNYAIIFDFQILNKAGAYNDIITIDHIYFPKVILSAVSNLDIATFVLDRPPGRPTLRMSSAPTIDLNKDVYMIGHPYGLPMKVAVNASVQRDDGYMFYTTLDAFQGNSGSPVFSLATQEVIGVLVAGEIDFQWNGSCNVSTICAIPYCDGEKAVKMAAIIQALPEISRTK